MPLILCLFVKVFFAGAGTFQGGPECPVITVDAGKSSQWLDVGAQMGVLQVRFIHNLFLQIFRN